MQMQIHCEARKFFLNPTLHLLHRLDFFTDKCLLFGEQLNEKRCCPVVQI